MEQDWRSLAETVPETLFLVAYEATKTGGLLHRAAALHSDVAACAATAAALREGGAPPAPVAHGPPPLFGAFPYVLRELALLHSLHDNASTSFLLSGAALGFDHGPIWQGWQERCADTLRCTAAAMQRLRAGDRHARMFVGAIVLAWTFPRGSPMWRTWTAIAERLATHAAVTVAMLFHAARRLRDAAAREFIEAWMVLNWDRM